MFWRFVAPKHRGKPCSSSPIFSGPFGEVGEVFVWVKSLDGRSRKVKALFKAGFGPGLGNVLEICGTQTPGETVLEFPHFFRTVWGSR